MIVFQVVGYILLLMASISSSVSMNFQKLAQHSTHFEDPRTCRKRREQPLTTHVLCRPYFVLALFLSAAASTLDFLALTWLTPSTVGVFGCLSIIINLFVTRIILSESLERDEWVAVGWVVVGCFLAISVNVGTESTVPPPRLIERTKSCVYIVANWCVFIILERLLHYVPLSTKLERFGYPFIAGALGAQNVCMGKYIAYAISNAIAQRHLAVRTDVLVAAILLCASSVVVHIAWLNRAFAKYDASYCILVYQTAWFLFTIVSGIVVYDNMATLNGIQQACFYVGCFLAAWGVWRVSVVRGISHKA